MENLLVYRRVSTRNEERDVLEFGTPHPDKKKFPFHKLTAIERVGDSRSKGSDQQETKYILWYASDLAKEDYDNWEHTVADIGERKFSSVKRTYIVSKEDYDSLSPKMGSAMPDVPKGKFEDGYILAKREQIENPDKRISSLYVLEARYYIKRASIRVIGYDKTFGVPVSAVTTLHYALEDYESENPNVTNIKSRFDLKDGFGLMPDGSTVTGEQLSDNWYSITTTESIEDAINNYSLIYQSYSSLNLPNVLLGVSVIYNEGKSEGAFASNWEGDAYGTDTSLGGSESASASSSVFIQPEPIIDIQEGFSGKVPTEVHVFYSKQEDLKSKIDAIGTHWPVFHPQSHTLVLFGQSGSVSAKSSASASSTIRDSGVSWSRDKNDGSGSDKDIRGTAQVVKIPPTIHGQITILGTNNVSDSATATCDCGWTGEGSLNFPAVTALSEANIEVKASFSPESLGATNGATSIPTTGTYILNVSVSPFENNYVKVAVEAFDAQSLNMPPAISPP